MENQTLRNIQQNLANSGVRPLYADEIVIAHTVKTGRDGAGKPVKEGHLHLAFIDMMTHKPVEKVVLSPTTARGLVSALTESLSKLDKEIKSGKVEKAKKVETDYIR